MTIKTVPVTINLMLIIFGSIIVQRDKCTAMYV
ncbi:MAG: hypothetical protein ACI976_002720, partial [Aureispira sp.]